LLKTNYAAVSQRGVVFFRNQDIGIDDQKILGQKLGELTGKPATSKVCLYVKLERDRIFNLSA
jgi:hypothetical protein